MLNRFRLFCLAIACMSITAGTFQAPALAAEEDDIKYRKNVMKALGGHMGSVASIVGGKAGPAAHLPGHVAAIVDISMMTKDLFPEGSDFGETTALPKIWEDPGAFTRELRMFEAAAATLGQAAGSGDMAAIGAALGELGKSCKSCHENFRQKK